MTWRAWYTDGRLFEGSTVEAWKALPAVGILIAVAYTSTGRTIYDGCWLWIEGEGFGFVPSNPWGEPWPEPPVGKCSDCLKRGAVVSDDEWARLLAEVWSTPRPALAA